MTRGTRSGAVSPEARLALLGYWIAAGLFLDQLIQIWSVVEGVDLAVPSWRFQLSLVFSGKALVLILATVIAIGTARLRRSSPPTPVLRFGLVAMGVGFLLMAAVLVIDGSAVAYSIPGAQFRGFTASRVRGIGVSLAGAALFWGLYRAVRSAPGAASAVPQAPNQSPR